MNKKTITRADLCEAVYQNVGLSRTESAALVELVLKEITDCLERGETVKLSSFGSFVVRRKGQRIGRNPKTGTEVPISARRVMVFKPAAILKHRINGGWRRPRLGTEGDLERIRDASADLPAVVDANERDQAPEVVRGERSGPCS